MNDNHSYRPIIIDSHCHFGVGDGLTGPWDTRADISKYVIRAKRAGIDRTVLIPALSNDYTAGNLQIAEMIRKYPRKYDGYVSINPNRDRQKVAAIVGKFVKGYGFTGMKIHHYNGTVTREVCQTALRYNIPVLWDVGDDIGRVETVAAEYRTVRFIIPHLGSYGGNWSAQKRCIDIVSRYPNVYSDTSGVRRFDLLEEAVVRAGAEKLLFGSDGPFHHPAVELEKIRQLNLSNGDVARILAGNWLNITGRVRSRYRTLSTAPESTQLQLVRAGGVWE